jgi:hypothetical protein
MPAVVGAAHLISPIVVEDKVRVRMVPSGNIENGTKSETRVFGQR